MGLTVGLTVCVLLAVFAALGWGLAARNGDERDRWKRRAEAAEAALAAERFRGVEWAARVVGEMRALNRQAEAAAAGRVPFADLGDDGA